MKPESNELEDDPEHPIPRLDTIDTFVTLKSGKVWCGIVAARPLQNDLRTRQRLLRKIETYLGHLNSEKMITEFGAPNPTKSRVYVGLPTGTESEIVAFLESCREWMSDNGADLIVHELKGETSPEIQLWGSNPS